MKLKEGDIILVHWIDQSYYNGPIKKTDKAIEACHGHTVGWFCEEDKEWLSIASENMEFGNSESSRRHIMTFPKVCITKIDVINKGARRG